MLRNYFKVMFRNVLKTKLNLAINLIGLTTAIGCVILAIGYANEDLSYDQFHRQKDNLYLLHKRNVNNISGAEVLDSQTSGLMGPTMLAEYPEVAQSVRFAPWFDEVVLSYNETNLKVSDFVFADSVFFSVFDFDLIAGDPERVLAAPSNLVLTETTASTLFGDEDPLGKIVIGINNIPMQVTGIVNDPPIESHIQFEALASWSTTVDGVGPLSFSFFNNWLGQTLYTYLLLEAQTDPDVLEGKLGDFMQRNFPERADSYFLKLLPFNDIYLHSSEFQNHRNLKLGSYRFNKLFAIISLAIVLLACVNYVNISTAKATQRAAEVGIRKVMGAHKKELIFQFFGESVIICFIAIILAFFFIDLSLPYFNSLTGKSVSSAILFEKEVLWSLAGILLAVSVLAGFYPAIYVSSYQPNEILRTSRNKGGGARLSLTVFQFVVSIVLIALTLVIFNQTRYLKQKDLGFNKDQIVVVNINNEIGNHAEAFRNALVSQSFISSVSVCRAAIGTGTFGTTVIPEGLDREISTQSFRVDEHFIDTYQMEVIEGVKLAPDGPAGVVVNEMFARLSGWEEVIGKQVRFNADDDPVSVIGLVKDFNYEAINKHAASPVIMFLYPGQEFNASIRIAGNNIPEAMNYLENLWNTYESRYPFEYYFVDEWFDSQYKSETRTMETITVFAIFSILIACLGLYGLTSYILEQKYREISIRKVFGATAGSILMLLNKRFVRILSVALLISAPIIYLLGSRWLSDFPYRIGLDPWIFLLAGGTVIGVALVAVTLQAMQAAWSNPAQILRNK